MRKLLDTILGRKTKDEKQKEWEEQEHWINAAETERGNWEKDVAAEAETFLKLLKPRNDGAYQRVAMGDYPEESDEVWIEGQSGKAGIRHDDATGFIVLSDLRRFLATSQYFMAFYKEQIKQGCDYPVGSAAIKFARRAK